jgi:protein-disulfide isomerase
MQDASNKGLLIGVVAVAVLVFGGLVWAIISAPPATPIANGTLTFDDANDPFIGPENATTVVRLYSDFQCPACRAAESSVNYAIAKYKDKVKFVWKDFPLMTIHPNARLASNAGRCAQDQGKFWEMKAKLYDQQTSWEGNRNPSADFKAYASQLGMNVDQFNTCLDDRANDAKVMAAYQEGVRNGVDRTPTVFIGEERLFGLTPAEWDQKLANRP